MSKLSQIGRPVLEVVGSRKNIIGHSKVDGHVPNSEPAISNIKRSLNAVQITCIR